MKYINTHVFAFAHATLKQAKVCLMTQMHPDQKASNNCTATLDNYTEVKIYSTGTFMFINKRDNIISIVLHTDTVCMCCIYMLGL